MTPHPCFPSSSGFADTRNVGRIIRVMVLACAFLAGAIAAQATLYQYIDVNVMSPEKFRIGRKVYPLSEMTAVVKAEIRGDDRVCVKLFFPLGLRKDIKEDIMERCRKAGAESFFIVSKS